MEKTSTLLRTVFSKISLNFWFSKIVGNSVISSGRKRHFFLNKSGPLLLLAVCLLIGAQSQAQTPTPVTFPTGSYIINMGVFTGNRAADIKTQLKPYGLIYDLIKNHNVPIYWVISPTKSKDGADFFYDGTEYKGGTFIIHKDYITNFVLGRIIYWKGYGVVLTKTTSPLTLTTTYKFTSVPYWTLDHQNGMLSQEFFLNAGIPPSAYNETYPNDLGMCNDVFVLPHSDPNWSSHANLLNWNLTSKGAIWAACHAVSALETIFNHADQSQQQNYLTEKTGVYTGTGHFADNSLIVWSKHKKPTAPFITTSAVETTFPVNFGPILVSPSDPVAQFMGTSDAAHTNGAEQVYLPVKNGGWRSTTRIVTYDPTHPDIPLKSNGPAAIIAYGRGFGDLNRGLVMYEAGHTLNKGTSGDVPAQRAFFNWSWLTTLDKSPQVVSVTGFTSDSKFKSQPYPQNYPLTVNFSSPVSAGVSNVTWSCTRSDNGSTFGSFSPNNSVAAVNTMFTPSITYDNNIPCILTVKITDQCGRVCFETYPITVTPVPRTPIANPDLGYLSQTCAIQGYSAIVNALSNDYDPDGDSLTITNVSGIFPADGTWSTDGSVITFTPALNFFGPTTATYTICDNTPPGYPYYGPLCATSTVVVGVGSADPNGCYPGSVYGIESNTRITLASLQSEYGTGALLTGTALSEGEDFYTLAGVDYLNMGTNNNNNIVLATGKTLRAKDIINLAWSKGATGTATISVQVGQNATGPWTNSQTFTLSLTGVGSAASIGSAYVIPAGVDNINYIRISAGTYPNQNSSVNVWLDGVDFDYLKCIPAIPIAYNDVAYINEDIPKTIKILENDYNPGNLPLTITITTPPQNGKISINTDNSLTYVTHKDYPTGGNSNDTITYLVCNTQGLCAYGNVYLTLIDDGCAANNYIPPGTIVETRTYQEGTANSVEDNVIDQEKPLINYGTITTWKVGKQPYRSNRTIIRFNGLSTIPTNADVQSAIFSVYETGTTSKKNSNLNISLHSISEQWTETGSTWENKDAVTPWAITGGSYTTPAFCNTTINTAKNEWKTFNISSMVQQWIKTPAYGGVLNNGFLIKQSNESISDVTCSFASSENNNSSRRPKLVVTYIIPPFTCEAIPNRAPLANPDNAITLSDTPIDIDVLLNDAEPDNNPLYLNSIIGTVTGGTASISNNKIKFTPDGVFTGTTTFMYDIRDNSGLKDTAYVKIRVDNVAPKPQNDVLSVLSNTYDNSANVQSNDANPDGPNPLITSVQIQPLHGNALVQGSNILYTPTHNYTGTDTLTYRVCEPPSPNVCTGQDVCSDAKLTITVINRPPVPYNDDFAISPCLPFIMDLVQNDYDPESGIISINSISPLSNPSVGNIINNGNGTVTFTPTSGFMGIVSFTYDIIDNGTPNEISQTTATVTIEVTNPINNPPVAKEDYWEMNINTTEYISVLDNDYDPDGQPLDNPIITIFPSHGTASVLPNGLIEYIPNYNYYGFDSIKYSICDIVINDYLTCAEDNGMCDNSYLVISVYKPNVNPTLNYSIPPNGSVICNNYNIVAYITPGSGGGVGATDLYEYSINNGYTWMVYQSGEIIPTNSATTKVMVRTSRSAGSFGVPTGPIVVGEWYIGTNPTNPTLFDAVPPNGTPICSGHKGSALFNPGYGGSTGAMDVFEYSINDGYTWQFYTPGMPISSVNATGSIKIRGFRTAGYYGCMASQPEIIVIWPIAPAPPPPTVAVNQPTCDNPSGTIILSNLPSQWSIDPDGYTGNTTNFIIDYLPSGLYTYVVTNEITGCISPPVNVFITKPPDPPEPVYVEGGTVVCSGSVILTASGGAGGTIYFQGTESEGTSTDHPSVFQIVDTTSNFYFRALSPSGCWGVEGVAEVFVLSQNNPFTTSEKTVINTYLPSGGFVNLGTSGDWSSQNWCKFNSLGDIISLTGTPSDTTDVFIYRGECITPVINVTDNSVCRSLTLGDGTIVNVEVGKELYILGNFLNRGVFSVFEDTTSSKGGLEKIYVKGDWDNEAGEFYAGKGTVIFNGIGPQRISTRDYPFYDLIINKGGSKGDEEVVLLDETTVYNSLTLENGRVNLNNHTLIMDNSDPASIQRTNGYIYAEDSPEQIYNRVRWNLGSSENLYSVPFGKSSSEYIPMSIDIKSNHMSSEGYLEFSTYGTPNTNLPLPLGVNHLGTYNDGGLVVNRFWYLDDSDVSSTIKVDVEGYITFTYLADELDNIIESQMIAQRFNDTLYPGRWADILYTQDNFSTYETHGFCVNTPVQPGGNTGTFKTSYIDTAQFFSVWTLSTITCPLPIKLLNFDAQCNGGYVELKWTTATETNSNHFTLEKSFDGIKWQIITTIDAAGYSSTETNYAFVDENNTGAMTYYRLKQTDNDGNFEVFKPVVVNCSSAQNNQDISVYPNPTKDAFSIFFSNIPDETAHVYVYDALGNTLYYKKIDDLKEQNGKLTFDLSKYTDGIYYVKFESDSQSHFEKIIKQRK